jgi:hypothetical protein
MGERVDAAANGVVEHEGQELIACPICGEDPPNGHGTVEFAEGNWIEVEGSLYCNIEHAALGYGLSPAQAQLAKAQAAREIARDQGVSESIIRADEDRVRDIVENPDEHPYAVALEEVADDDTHERETPEEEKNTLSAEDQEWADQLLEELRRGDD